MRVGGATATALLDKVELRVLELLAGGCSIKEVAHELQISNQKVYRIRQTLLEQAKAKSAQDLTRYAIELGLLGVHRRHRDDAGPASG
jgi:DNA-binding NarL/FixJ family response regulator